MSGARGLPEDVVREILSTLPVKSLMRFRCVCKSWYALIKSPSFIDLHLTRRASSSSISRKNNDSIIVKRSLVQHDDRGNVLSFFSIVDDDDDDIIVEEEKDLIDIPIFLKEDKHVFLLGGPSCNGIICITNHLDIILCNPAIREFRALSLPSKPFHNPDNMLHWPEGVGFRFDPNTGDYKVVRIVYHCYDDGFFSSGDYKVEVYNLSTDSWREIDTNVPPDIKYSPCFATLFNGAFHWYARKGESEYILSFHMSNEVFQSIPFPDGWSYPDGHYRSLYVLNESLALIRYESLEYRRTLGIDFPDEKYFDIWVMTEYGVKESWTRHFKIGPLSGVEFPLAFCNDGSELILETKNGQLISCNIRDQNIKEFPIHGLPATLSALVYSESLVSIKRENGSEESA